MQADEEVLKPLYKVREAVAGVRYDSNLIVDFYLPGTSVRMQVVLKVQGVEYFAQTSLALARTDYLVDTDYLAGKVASHYYLPVM